MADPLRDRAALARCGRLARMQLAGDMHADAWSGEQDQTGQGEFSSPGMVPVNGVVRAGARLRSCPSRLPDAFNPFGTASPETGRRMVDLLPAVARTTRQEESRSLQDI